MAANTPKATREERREAARLEAVRLREQAAKREKRNRGILIGAVVLVIALIATAGFFIYQAAGRTLLSDFEGEVPAGSNLHGGIPIGSEGAGSTNEGAVEVDIYLDFLCPYCGQFEQVNGEDVAELAADGTATINYHPLANLDNASAGTMYSTRAANAFATVSAAEPALALPFVEALFANQPAEGGPGLTDEEIAAIAVEAGVSQEVADSLAAGTYTDWVGVATQQSQRDGVSGTPTIHIDGQDWTGNWTEPGAFLAAVTDAA
ncbi:DsbA family protein [Occultella kanbiaonis]|uniref:DsbA family protein n=1 Tax=Occultella kanbiaonis TaxID=2675754 RepID=UPI0013D158D3|nr:DsbA family protein [Occultella kanbiaonis]